MIIYHYTIPSDNRELQQYLYMDRTVYNYTIPSDNRELQLLVRELLRKLNYTREFDTLKSKKVPQSLEIGLFFCQIFIFII